MYADYQNVHVVFNRHTHTGLCVWGGAVLYCSSQHSAAVLRTVARSLQAFTAGFTSEAALCWIHTRINFNRHHQHHVRLHHFF